MVDGSGTTSYTQDTRGRVTNKVVSWAGGPTISVNYPTIPHYLVTPRAGLKKYDHGKVTWTVRPNGAFPRAHLSTTPSIHPAFWFNLFYLITY